MPRKGDSAPAIDRFRSKVRIQDDGCHVWTASGNSGHGAKGAEPYGQFWGGRLNAQGKPIMERAHRWIWQYTHGPIPNGLLVLHRCDNPACVRLDHLWLGTNADNAADMWAKGRGRQGSQGPAAKLTPEQVATIRSITGRSQQSIADEYGVCQKTISNIVRDRTWTNE